MSSERYIISTKEEIKEMKEKIKAKKEEQEEKVEEQQKKKGGKKEVVHEEKEEVEEDSEPWIIKFDPKKCTEQSRWIIPAKRTIRIFVKYYNT